MQTEKNSKMETKHDTIMQAIAHAANKAARVMVVHDMAAVRTDNNHRMQNTVSKIGGPIMQQPTFNW